MVVESVSTGTGSPSSETGLPSAGGDRPIRKWRDTAAYVLLILGMFGVLANAVVFYRHLNSLLDAGNAVRAAQHTERRISLFLETLLDAETGQRGYLLTGDAQYLRPYYRAAGLLDAQLAQLSQELGDDDAQDERLARLQPVVRRKLGELAESIAVRLDQGAEAARAFVARNTGIADMDEIRAILQSISADKVRRLNDLEETYHSTRQITMVSLGVFVGTSLALVVVVIVMIRRADRQRIRAIEDHAGYIAEIGRKVAQLRRERNEIADVNEMASFLQSSNSTAELGATVGAFLERSFPALAGRLYVFSPSRNDLQLEAAFGTGEAVARLSPDQCWGLRRGEAHAWHRAAGVPACTHHADADDGPSLCLPLIAHGETIGLLTLAGPGVAGAAAGDEDQDDGVRRLADAAARHLALAVANLQLRDTLKEQSIRDPLTGAFNRRHFEIVGAKELAQCVRVGRSFALVMLDIDHFKRYNDVHGHAAGDAVLVALCDYLHQHIREADWLFRLGGEEFALLLREVDFGDAARRAEDLRAGIAGLRIASNDFDLPSVTVSMGLATWQTRNDKLDGVLARADEALYQSKAAGRNRLTVSPEGAPASPAGSGRD